MSNGETACYLYCLTPSGRGIQTAQIGVDGQHPVFVRACGETGAILGEVAIDEFCGEAAEARLEDLAWLGPRVCRHAAVIEEVMRQTPVLPARFATLFTSLDSLQRSVLENQRAIARFFAELGDKQEWAVKGLLDRAGSLRKLGAAEVPAAAATPGAKYFQEKRMKAQLERDFNHLLKEYCRRAAAALGAHPSVFRERKLVAPVTDAEDAEVVLNWAFLVSPAALDDFRARLERLNDSEAFPGLRLTLSGPWPPYSFAPNLSGGEQA
jgi:hypothetical protein